VIFSLHWTTDSVFGAGTWSVAAPNTLGCGGGSLAGNGTVTLAAHRTGDQIAGSTQFSNGWGPPFLGVLTDANTLGAHWMSIDATLSDHTRAKVAGRGERLDGAAD
jgi:hypothetical protein